MPPAPRQVSPPSTSWWVPTPARGSLCSPSPSPTPSRMASGRAARPRCGRVPPRGCWRHPRPSGAPDAAGGVQGKDNTAGTARALLQVGGHCKNVPTLEYGFLVQVSALRPAGTWPRTQSVVPSVPCHTCPHPATQSISPLPHIPTKQGLAPAVVPRSGPKHLPGARDPSGQATAATMGLTATSCPADHEVRGAAHPDAQRVLRGVRRAARLPERLHAQGVVVAAAGLAQMSPRVTVTDATRAACPLRSRPCAPGSCVSSPFTPWA